MKNFIIALLFLFCCGNLSAQLDLVPRVISAPNTASLGMYGDIPVGYYTGIPDIHIPLYDLELDGMKIPLSLSYHASGVRVGQDAGWVGMGWTLNAGGCIVNGVRGWSDMGLSILSRPDLEYVDTDKPGNLMKPEEYDTYREIALNKRDGEPDIYYYNFGGYSGSFFTQMDFESESGKTKNVIRKPDSFLDIEWDGGQWIVTDGNGFKYYFGTEEEVRNHSQSYTSAERLPISYSGASKTKNLSVPLRYVDPDITGAWYLDVIESPNGQKLNFAYTTERIFTPLTMQEEVYEPTGGLSPRRKQNTVFTFAEISQVILKSITGPNIQINFSGEVRHDIEPHPSHPKPTRLAEISVGNGSSVIKKYKFDYFYTGTLDDYDNCRLYLKTVQEYGSDGSAGGIHSFEYDHPESLPSKISTDIDYWGYYTLPSSYLASNWWGEEPVTDRNYSTLLPPYKNGKLIFYGQNRNSDPERMRYGTLKSIKYPTGGQTVFEFEPHTIVAGSELPDVPTPPAPEDMYSVSFDEQYDGYDGSGFDDFPTGVKEGDPFEITSPVDAFFEVEAEFWIDEADVMKEFWAETQYTAYLMKLDAATGRYLMFKGLHFPTMYEQGHYKAQQEVYLDPGTYRIDIRRLYTFDDLQYFVASYDILGSAACLPLNKAARQAGGDRIGGGLCVHSIESTDENGNVIRREFDYNEGKLMAPIISHQPVHLEESEEVKMDNGDSYEVRYVGDYIYVSSGSYVPLSNSASGGYVGYSSVTETLYEGNQVAGYKQYEFYNEYDDVINTRHFVPGFPTYPNLKNGLLIRKSDYNDDYQLVRDEQYNYKFTDGPTAKGVKAYLPFTVETDRVSHTVIAMIKWYRLHSLWSQLESKVVSQYNPEGERILSTTEKYTYEPSNYKVKELQVDDSRTDISHLKIAEYPVDKKNTSTVYAEMVKARQVNPVVEERNYVLRNGVRTLQDTRRMNYGLFAGNPQPLSLMQNKDKGGSTLEKRVEITHYDINGKPNDYVKGGLEKVVYLWGYNSQYPVAKIEGATYAEVEGWLGATAISNLANNSTTVDAVLNTIRSTLSGKGVMVTTYTYKPLVGMTSMTAPNGGKTTYEYDSLGRLVRVKDHSGKVVEQYDYHFKN